ncbi:MAG: PGF-pre-PGF domain-containing protein [Methanocorpusculum sp.]|nr:PGF-pre-PGF domain-containing protein [Methanocorpusculum sp.]
MKKILAAIIIASIILIGAVSAEETIPLLPAQYFGTAQTTNANPITAGTEITAELNGETFTYKVIENGKIGEAGTFDEKFIISPSNPSAEGKVIKFKIGSVEASQTVTFESGKSESLALIFAVEAQTKGTENKIITAPPIVISENPIPQNFALVVETIPQSQKDSLPKFSQGTTVLKIVEITPENPPAGNYKVILTFTLTPSEIASLGVTKDKIILMHHNGAQNKWDSLRTWISSETGGAVNYSAEAESFSAFAIGASTTATQTAVPASTNSGSGSSGGNSVSTQSPQQSYTAAPQTEQTIKPSATASYAATAQAKPTETKTPFALAGLIAGLACAMVLLRK